MQTQTIQISDSISIMAECSRTIRTTTNIDGCEYEIAPKTHEYYHVAVLQSGKPIASRSTFKISDSIGHVQFRPETAKRVQQMLNQLIAMSTTTEWIALKKRESRPSAIDAAWNNALVGARDAAMDEVIEHNKMFGLCDICHTYCYGDCEA